MAKTITMQDIADKIGVSKVTVSKALSDKDGVSDEMKEKIKDLADEMGYRYNAQASAIKSGQTFNVGVIVADRFIGDYKSYYLTVFQHLTKALDVHRYSSILNILTDEEETNLVLPKSYFDRKVDGYIILGQLSKKYVDTLNECEVPILFFDFYDDHINVDSINVDNFYGSYGITNYLINNNHREIAYVGSIKSTSSIQDRYLGYCKSLLEHNITQKKDYVIEDRDEKGKFIPIVFPEKMPTAFVCNCDQVAYNCIEQLQNLGYRVPEDISVVGFDNNFYSTISKPKITTVDSNVTEMATTAARIIVEKINDANKTYGHLVIKGNIVIRDSVRKI